MKTADVNYYYLDTTEHAPREFARRQEELLRVAVALNRGSTAEELTDILFDSLDHLVPYDRIGLAKLSPDGILTLQYVRSMRPIIWGKGSSAPIAGSSLEPIVKERKIRIINDLAAYEKEHPQSLSASHVLAEGIRSSLTLPIFAGTDPVGVMFFSSIHPYAYQPRHVDFLRTLAAAFGLALERSELTASLQKANAELRTLDQLKSNFLSNISHELRTPLSRILGNAYALEDGLAGELRPEQHQLTMEIIGGADRLKVLFQDLIDFTELQAGRLEPELRPVDLGAIAAEVVQESRPTIEGAGLQLVSAIAQEPQTVTGDAPMLARAIAALLDNARKFTPAPGTVSVRAARRGGECWVEVCDTGIGIAPEHQAHLFDAFYQVESGLTRPYSGSGLGLALVRAITLAHGGLVRFESQPGKGSCFRIGLPAVETQPPEAPNES